MTGQLRTDIDGRVRLAAVIGHPVAHSLSPTIHNAAFSATDLDWVYVALDVAPGNGADAVAAMRALGIGGMSVTMPHKAAVAVAADERTPAAQRLGAANCLFWRDGRIVADSTDGDGFVAAYKQAFGQGFNDRRVAVFGAGGAAKAIIEAVGRDQAEAVFVYNRSSEALSLAVSLADQAHAGTLDDLVAADVIINASSVGMAGGPAAGGVPFDVDLIEQRHTIVDIVYNPKLTPLLDAARRRGARTLGGVPMLVHQAARAFELWTDRPAPLAAMLAAVDDHLG